MNTIINNKNEQNVINMALKRHILSFYWFSQQFLPVATTDDVFTGREKLELLAASTRVLATEEASGVVEFASVWSNINSAATFTDPAL